ncbi:MAG: TraB/GumN family protein, partial [Flavisolibacter sp.]
MIYRIRRAMMIIFLLGGCLFASSQQWPATLHWRISGNGLTKPSYLYGTMHLQDKRLFNFGDSVYQHIKDAEGFALELNFHDLLDSMFSKQIEEEETKFMEKADITIDRKKLDKGSDSLLKKLGIKGNNISKKDLKKIRDYQISQMVQEGEMQTIVDGYLYGLALRQSKWTGGIEDVSDQMNVLDEFGKELSPDNILQPAAVMKKSVEDMIQTYLKPDLQKLAGISDEDGW